MAYEDRYGSTTIRDTEVDNLTINIDENSEEDFKEIAAVMLHIPYMPDEEHSHIVLNRERATILRDWLTRFLDDKDLMAKYDKDVCG